MQIMAGKRERQVKLKGGKVERSAAPSGCIINPLLQAISKGRGGGSRGSRVSWQDHSMWRVVLPGQEPSGEHWSLLQALGSGPRLRLQKPPKDARAPADPGLCRAGVVPALPEPSHRCAHQGPARGLETGSQIHPKHLGSNAAGKEGAGMRPGAVGPHGKGVTPGWWSQTGAFALPGLIPTLGRLWGWGLSP